MVYPPYERKGLFLHNNGAIWNQIIVCLRAVADLVLSGHNDKQSSKLGPFYFKHIE